jgi:hypothetical protein
LNPWYLRDCWESKPLSHKNLFVKISCIGSCQEWHTSVKASRTS